MATDKKSFLLYCDLIHTVKKMPKEDAGELLLHILEYVNDLDPQTDNITVDLVFEPIKQQLKRDLKKYDALCDKNKDNALKRWNKINATASERIPNDAKHADTDTDTDKDINKKQTFETFWNIYDKKLDHKTCKAKWLNLKQTDIDKILLTLPNYILSTPDKQFRKHPKSYLHNECWNDEASTVVKHKTNEDLYAEHVMKQIRANS